MSIATTANEAAMSAHILFRVPKCSARTYAAWLQSAHADRARQGARLPETAMKPDESDQTRVVLGRPLHVTSCGWSTRHTEPEALVGTSRAKRHPLPATQRKASGDGGDDRAPKQNGTAPPASPSNTPPASPDLGPNLLSAYRLLDAACFWFERLASEYIDILTNIGKASDFSFAGKPLAVLDDAFSGGDDWLCNGWHWTLVGRYQRQRIGAMSFVIDLGNPGRPAHALGQPCALVAWSGVAFDWVPGISLAGGFWPPSPETTRLLDGRLVQWTGAMPGNGQSSAVPLRSGSWFYLLPLAALTSLPRVRELVVQPALELLKGTPVEAAFANAPEVLKFSRRKGELVIAS